MGIKQNTPFLFIHSLLSFLVMIAEVVKFSRFLPTKKSSLYTSIDATLFVFLIY